MYRLSIKDMVDSNNDYTVDKPFMIGILEHIAVSYGEEYVDGNILDFINFKEVSVEVDRYGTVKLHMLPLNKSED